MTFIASIIIALALLSVGFAVGSKRNTCIHRALARIGIRFGNVPASVPEEQIAEVVRRELDSRKPVEDVISV